MGNNDWDKTKIIGLPRVNLVYAWELDHGSYLFTMTCDKAISNGSKILALSFLWFVEGVR